ncbi:PREDICTED: phosphatidylinositol 4-kinase beta-like isoform X2 [Amphimedon queenslandica]|uniref:Phosphatidylinositol 4-kinase beta n=1 Tax=Amphimedon queenslandica TaxID=400682 RepID=A0AAN0JGW0_AMPQE|nr:PREDICTED: phosphatidylinositol 4-kinase beta-like isoform X1 [Amphimedon queenslandica]XP_019856022.1 PREDICTED: phosphatidylinositol 4-kinase beta-like isoform X2 [Amphimedon queenslandica]|eukprot:XP_003388943.1 PREDICTED: phosphatidylinositol 4-kinase beta-like isoform X1 [Amphimedon queenslandica]
MDDPLLGLAMWETETEANRLKRSSSTCSKSSKNSADPVEEKSTSLDPPPPLPLPDNKREQERREKDTNMSSHNSSECFPCLSALDQDLEQKLRQTKDKDGATDPKETEHTDSTNEIQGREAVRFASQSPEPLLESFLLLRLFESNLFTMHIAVQYLFKEREANVQKYLGKKLKDFDDNEVDFYLPELANMYVHVESLYPVLHKYFLSRCRYDVIFSLKLAWLLTASISDTWLPSSELQTASRMLSLIKTEQIRPPLITLATSQNVASVPGSPSASPFSQDKHHHRSLSANSPVITLSSSMSTICPTSTQSCSTSNYSMNGNKVSIGDLRSGQAFDSGCTCFLSSSPSPLPVAPAYKSCQCQSPRLLAQDIFVRTLGHISKRLLKYTTRSLRTSQLYAELSQLNLNLPARVCLPLYPPTHQILRIPPTESVVLNSKSKAPYLLLVEVAQVEDTFLSPLTQKQLDVSLKSSGLGPDEVKNFVHSEGPSPVGTRVSSLPNLRNGGISADSVSLTSLDNYPTSSIIEEREEEAPASGEDKCLEGSSSNSSSSDKDEEGEGSPVTFHVSEIRRRLSKEIGAPKKNFSRNPDDPSAAAMKEMWENKVERIRQRSPYGHLPNWKLLAAIVKWGDDLRQELVSWQLLEQFKRIWKEENVSLWLRPYTVMVFSSDGGLVEPVCNAVSLHQIKKEFKGSLLDYFKHEYGETNSEGFLTSQRNFVESCAAYCLICYFIQVKDRHNGNILLDSKGHIIHIDFGFILAHSPGKNIRFESSPFKLTQEFVEVMGGVNSDMYRYFKVLMLQGFLAARKHMEQIVNIVDIMQTGSQLPCFSHGPTTVKQLQDRFHLSLTEQQLELLVNGMIETSMYSLTTKLYDGFQYLANGIM